MKLPGQHDGVTVHPARGASVAAAAPAVLVLPGGGYARHAPHEAEPVADWLAGLGLHAFILRYSTAPARHPAAFLEARAALSWIRTGAHGLPVDASRVGVLGFSAGGHLAACLAAGTQTAEGHSVPVPDLAILCYPVISFTDSPHQGCVDNLLGPAPSDALRKSVSAERHVSPLTPPAFLWHTSDDDGVSVEHSLRYSLALRAAGVPAELHVFPHGRHGLGLAQGEPGVSAWPRLCEDWLAGQGWIGDGRKPDHSIHGD